MFLSVYDDVPKAFEEWTNHGKKLYIYSSGSVQAQKLLFGNSVHGDLLKFISGHFDTEVGAKQEAESYKNILKKIDVEPSKVLFLTDIAKEAEAAKAAGLLAVLVIRDGNAELSSEDKKAFLTVQSFDELPFHVSHKRQKVDESSTSEDKNETPEKNEKNGSKEVHEAMDTTEALENVDGNVNVTDADKEAIIDESKIEKNTNSEPVKKIEEKVEEKVSREEAANSKEITTNVKNTDSAETSNDLHENGNQDLSGSESKIIAIDKTQTEKEIVQPATDGKELKSDTKDGIESIDHEKDAQLTKDEKDSSTKVNEEKVQPVVDETKPVKPLVEAVEEKEDSKASETDKSKTCESSKTLEQNNEKGVGKVGENAETNANAEKKVEENEKSIKNGKQEKEIGTKTLNGTSTNGTSDEVISNGKPNENGNTIEDAMKIKKPVLADGAAEPEITVPPVAVAASS